MPKQINCNVSGDPGTDIPKIFDDYGHVWSGRFEPGNTRCVFILSDSAYGGGHRHWEGHQENFLIPPAPGSYEGSSLGLPTMAYAPPISAAWPMKGTTEFNAPARMRAGEDIRPLLRQRRAAGATWVRSLAGGYPFRPDNHFLSMNELRRYWDLCAQEGLRVFQCVFAGTAQVPGADNQSWQINYWEDVKATASAYGEQVTLQLANEWNHSTQRINPQAFSPTTANLCDHGPGLTDEPPVTPYWPVVSWHARRECFVNGIPSAKAINNCNVYGFRHEPWPRQGKWVVGEMAKPADYANNPAYAYDMGRHCGIIDGGIFHSQEGVESRPWPAHIESCARAFYDGIDSVN